MAPTNPVDIARLGHRVGAYMSYTDSYLTWLSRLQSIDPTFTANMEVYRELGNVDVVGSSQDPTEFNITFNQNMFQKPSADFLMAGKDGLNFSTGSSFHMGNIISASGSTNLFVVMRANAATTLVQQMAHFQNLSVEELQYSFVVRQPCVFTPRLRGPLGKWYGNGSAFPSTPSGLGTWGTPDTTSSGAIRGRDARIFFGATPGQVSETTNKGYRLQSFTIRAAFPIQRVEELGTRALVGYLSDTPDVTIDYDILVADDQPIDEWATNNSTVYDMNNIINTGLDVVVRLYDPDAAEAATVVRSWYLANLVATQATPIRAQVRGLTTARYSARVARVETAGTGGAGTAGLVVFKGKDS